MKKINPEGVSNFSYQETSSFISKVYDFAHNEHRPKDAWMPAYRLDRFDHWLTNEEFMAEPFITYIEVEQNPDFINAYMDIEEKFLGFYREIFDITQTVAVTSDGDSDQSYNLYTFDSIEEFLSYMEENLREKTRNHLYFNHLGMMSLGAFDIASHLYFQKQDTAKVVEKWANTYGLYFLS